MGKIETVPWREFCLLSHESEIKFDETFLQRI